MAPQRPLSHILVHWIIRAYQLSFSLILGRQCRYLPTCSEYLDEAVSMHGLCAGGFLGLFRLCRCHPWGGFGFDPVPETLPPGAHCLKPWTYLTKPHPEADTRDPAK